MIINFNQANLVAEPADVGNELTHHYHGPTKFEYLIDWGFELKKIQSYQTPVDQRWLVGHTPKEVEILEWQDHRFSGWMDQLTLIANHPQVYNNRELKKAYTNTLAKIFEAIAQRATNGQDRGLPLGIIRAGAIAAYFLHPNKKRLLVNMKRLPFKDGRFGVGLIDKAGVLSQNFSGQTIEIDEVFLASGLTIISLLKILNQLNNLPAKVNIIAPFVTQVGIQWLLQIGQKLNLSITITGVRLYWHLDENLYVREVDSRPIYQRLAKQVAQPVFAGGDAGDLVDGLIPNLY